MKFRRFLAIVKKESLSAMRDPSTALIAFLLPLMLLFLMGYAVSLDAKNMPFGIANFSAQSTAKEIVSQFSVSKFFKTQIINDKKALKDAIKNGLVHGYLIIEDDSQMGLKFQIISDGSEPNTANFITQYAKYLIATTLGSSQDIDLRFWFNEKLSSQYSLIPGSMAVIMTLIGTLLTSLIIAREWEKGTLESLLSTPVANSEIILGKLVPYFVLTMFSAFICFLVSVCWYQIPFRGSAILLLLLCVVYVFTALCMGLFISTIAKNQFIAAQASMLASFLPAFLLSGYVFDINNMPPAMQIITNFIPTTYFVSSLNNLFLVGNVMNVYLRDICFMFVLGLGVFLGVVMISKRSLE